MHQNDLFICFTPLQIFIARCLIEDARGKVEPPDIVVFPLSDSERYRYYFNSVVSRCDKTFYLENVPRFPFYVGVFWKLFHNTSYRRVYVASIDSYYVHYILSFCRFKEIRTFDDGTANINPQGIYFRGDGENEAWLKTSLRSIFGKRYDSAKIKKHTKKHYTLYPQYKNISDKIYPLRLFDQAVPAPSEAAKGKAVVILGTVYNEIIRDTATIPELIGKMEKLINSRRGYDVHYLPHPRDESPYFRNVILHESPMISEEIILILLRSYKCVEVLGFSSSAQFNLIDQKGINNVIVETRLVERPSSRLRDLLVESGANVLQLDDL